MAIQKNVPLANYSTMRLGGDAKFLCEVTDKHELVNALDWAIEHRLQSIVIGGSSNIVWGDQGFDGLVIVNRITGFKILEDGDKSYVTIGAGENWDKSVAKTVRQGLSGIEALSLIPGTAGATPVQNVGAYGQEIADTLVSLEAYDTQNNHFVTLQSEDCQFGYRTSRFKVADKNRFVIVNITLHLSRTNPRPPYYPDVAKYLREKKIGAVTPKVLRQAVIAIRSAKLPDPAKIGNNGSFFANPIITKAYFKTLISKYPDMPNWPTKDKTVKISAAWLIEQVGLKGYKDEKLGLALWHKQPLVIVNESAIKTADLLKFRNYVVKTVFKKFGVELEQEPELIGKSKIRAEIN